jgi:hypothetical protein
MELWILQSFVQTAIDENGLSGDVGGALAGEPNDGVRQFPRITQALERCFWGPAFEDFFFGLARGDRARVGELFQSVGGGVARANVVDENAVFAKLVGEAFDQSDDGGAHRVRMHEVGYGLLGGDGGDRDDTSPPFLLHVGDHGVGKVDRAHEIEVHGAFPFVDGGGEKTVGGRAYVCDGNRAARKVKKATPPRRNPGLERDQDFCFSGGVG